ncbi:MAG TPA: hypothetical protein VKV32_08965 [Stellaceae bacterium]|nr:hypothetical protein [Stellaceae bacterium]
MRVRSLPLLVGGLTILSLPALADGTFNVKPTSAGSPAPDQRIVCQPEPELQFVATGNRLVMINTYAKGRHPLVLAAVGSFTGNWVAGGQNVAVKGQIKDNAISGTITYVGRGTCAYVFSGPKQ